MKNTKRSIAFLLAFLLCLALGTTAFAEQAETPEGGREGVDYVYVDAPEAANENGVITAEEWATVLPDICASYEANSDNNYTISYIAEDEDPYLTTIYSGYGFAKDYNSAEGHSYCLEDVQATKRPHALANCLTCKTADYTALVNAVGAEAYSYKFDDVVGDMSENVGCYTCHENNAGNAGELAITHDYTLTLDDETLESVDDAMLTCGQCHIEYYFDADTKATSIPYTNVESMSPEAMLAYYDSIDFADWTQDSTGARMLKAQHPEFETVLGEGGKHAALGLTCADCHMATETADDGTSYISHTLQSPLENQALLDTCASCHGDTDMTEKVHAIQEQVTARETEVGYALATLKNTLAAANQACEEATAAGETPVYTEEELDAIRELYRDAQWYFDFDYVENSEGAHNSTLANNCLDTSEELINQAMALFK